MKATLIYKTELALMLASLPASFPFQLWFISSNISIKHLVSSHYGVWFCPGRRSLVIKGERMCHAHVEGAVRAEGVRGHTDRRCFRSIRGRLGWRWAFPALSLCDRFANPSTRSVPFLLLGNEGRQQALMLPIAFALFVYLTCLSSPVCTSAQLCCRFLMRTSSLKPKVPFLAQPQRRRPPYKLSSQASRGLRGRRGPQDVNPLFSSAGQSPHPVLHSSRPPSEAPTGHVGICFKGQQTLQERNQHSHTGTVGRDATLGTQKALCTPRAPRAPCGLSTGLSSRSVVSRSARHPPSTGSKQ